MDKELFDKLKLLKSEAAKYFDFEQLILFGSVARAENTVHSDIDVAFIVNDLTSDYWSLSAKLFEIVNKIDYHIEPVILIKSDDKSGFTESVLNKGISIN